MSWSKYQVSIGSSLGICFKECPNKIPRQKISLKKWGKYKTLVADSLFLQLNQYKKYIKENDMVVCQIQIKVSEAGSQNKMNCSASLEDKNTFDCFHLSPSVSDARSWSLSSSGLFTIKSFSSLVPSFWFISSFPY